MAKERFDIIISDAALSMLDSHINFLARVSKDAALKLMDEILNDINSLCKHPNRYPIYENQYTL